MFMLFAFAGRKASGKNTCATELVKRGFQEIAFADYLKKTISKAFNWKLEDFYTLEGKEKLFSTPFIYNKKQASIISDLTDIPLENLYTHDVEMCKIRDSLSYIGTNLIRKYDVDFHIKKTLSLMEKNKNYVICDERFLNEKESLDKFGCISVFVLRPYYWEYNNHLSEIDLRRNMFDYVLVNNNTQSALKEKINVFIDECFNGNVIKNRKKITKKIEGIKSLEDFKYCQDMSAKCLYPKERKYYLDPSFNVDIFSQANKESSYYAGYITSTGALGNDFLDVYFTNEIEALEFNKCIGKNDFRKHLFSFNRYMYCVQIYDSFVLDDLKLWNIVPGKRVFTTPHILYNNTNLLIEWLRGIIKGIRVTFQETVIFDSDSTSQIEKLADILGVYLHDNRIICNASYLEEYYANKMVKEETEKAVWYSNSENL